MIDNWGVFLVIVSLLGFIGTVYTMFYKPIHELTLTIERLNINLEHVKKNDSKQDDKIDRHEDILNTHNIRITKLEQTNFIKDRKDH